MDKEVNVAICMGSSCFARGNNKLLQVLEDAVRENGWQDRIALSGMRCQNLCSQGPVVSVDGVVHKGLDAEAVIDLLVVKLAVKPAVSRYASVRRNVREDR